jgi:hypothetical protein
MARTLAAVLPSLAALGGALGLSACGGAGAAGPTVLLADSASVAAAAADPITVSPLPDTPDASPATQISFLGPAGTTVGHVHVSGSRTGVHRGTLRGYSTGTGESFLPARPFAEGERVSVSARVLSGPMRGRVARSTFTVAAQAPISQQQFPTSTGDARAVQHYASAPGVTPSTVTIKSPAAPGAASGYLLLAPYQGQGTAGPMIADQSGGLIWFDPLPAGMAATNLSVQRYEGRPVLTWWQGRVLQLGFGEGEQVIADSSYRRIATVHAGNGYRGDLHVTRITPAGTAWLGAYDPVRMNLTAAGGAADGVLDDSLIEEVDIKTGLVMWEWHALGHIPFGDSKNPPPGSSYPWDFAHVNSVDPGPGGDLLVSFRNTWSVDDLDPHSGGFHWRIGGARSTFSLGRGVKFYWQHDAAFQPGGEISLFDNGSDPPEERQSRGLLLSVDPSARSVRLVKQFVNPSRTLLASSQGSTRGLAGGDWLLGYGGLPDFTEFDGSGRVVLDGTLGPGVQNFSTSIAQWSGRPQGAPAAVIVPGAGAPSVAASWNGATDVAAWRLLAGAASGTLAPVATAPRSGFQTSIPVPSGSRYLAVQALDGAGAVIGVSATIGA